VTIPYHAHWILANSSEADSPSTTPNLRAITIFVLLKLYQALLATLSTSHRPASQPYPHKCHHSRALELASSLQRSQCTPRLQS